MKRHTFLKKTQLVKQKHLLKKKQLLKRKHLLKKKHILKKKHLAASQCGYVVSTSAFRQGDPGSNPRAARKSCEDNPGLGILQQWNPYPASYWDTPIYFNVWPSVRMSSMLCGISMRPKYPGYWRRRALMTNDGKPSLLPLHFKLSSLDGAQAGPARTPSTIDTQHSILRITWPKTYTVYSVIDVCDPKYHK